MLLNTGYKVLSADRVICVFCHQSEQVELASGGPPYNMDHVALGVEGAAAPHSSGIRPLGAVTLHC